MIPLSIQLFHLVEIFYTEREPLLETMRPRQQTSLQQKFRVHLQQANALHRRPAS